MSWGAVVLTGREPRTRGTGRNCARGTGGGVCADACGRGFGRRCGLVAARRGTTRGWTGSPSGS